MDLTATAACLSREIDWLERVIEAAIGGYLAQPGPDRAACPLAPPDIASDRSAYAGMLREGGFGRDERLILILALAPEIRPQALDPLQIRNPQLDRRFTEFGGITSSGGPFLPTVETALFLLAAGDLARRFEVLGMLGDDAPLAAGRFLQPRPPQHRDGGDGIRPLHIARGRLARLLTGRPPRASLRADAPARRLTTRLSWDDLILPARTRHDVGEILDWMEYGDGLRRHPAVARLIPPGYRSLFYGPPGTGKTLTAALLGQRAGREVYRVDLSLVVSKWVGETEKNLADVFDEAEDCGWILFFDEADALFGKRTDVSHAQDRYANQQVSYILQRVEEFGGVVVLASNLRGNIDSAFSRQFQSMIRFPVPGPDERRRLWQNAIGGLGNLDPEVDPARLAERHELTGGAIVNVLRHALLHAARRGDDRLALADLEAGIGRELRKDGRTAGGER